jgi:DNA recombination protein RmuC
MSTVTLPTLIVAFIGGLSVGLLLGGLIMWLAQRARGAALDERLGARERELAAVQSSLQASAAELETLRAELRAASSAVCALESRAAAERESAERERAALSETFAALSAQALDQNARSFLALATASLGTYQEAARGDLERRQAAIDATIRPIADSLGRLDDHVRALESARAGAYGELRSELVKLSQTQERLRAETQSLVKALRSPTVRGQWGEIQLRRAAELAGILELCRFQEQIADEDDEARRRRPDLTVRMPSDRIIFVDAKAPLGAYLDAIEIADEVERRAKMEHHARQVRAHALQLAQKGYWRNVERSPEFVVLFLPGEQYFGAALEVDPLLADDAMQQRVIIATPTTLVALLRAVYHGWRHEQIAAEAEAIGALGRDLYDRLRKIGEHFANVGDHLAGSVRAYNEAVGSLDRRVMATARKFGHLSTFAADRPIPELDPIEEHVRQLKAPEFRGLER